MINTLTSWIAVVSWLGAGAVLLAEHVAKVAIPEDLVISTVGVACTLIVVRAVLSLRTDKDIHYDRGWQDCQRTIDEAVQRERARRLVA